MIAARSNFNFIEEKCSIWRLYDKVFLLRCRDSLQERILWRSCIKEQAQCEEGDLTMHGPMDDTHDSMDMTMKDAIYWRKNQVVLTIFSNLEVSASISDIAHSINTEIQDLNARVLQDMPFSLERLNILSSDALDDITGIYVYSAPLRAGSLSQSREADIAVFCNIKPKRETRHGGAEADESHSDDATLQVVNQLNAYAQSNTAQTPFHAMPNWLGSCVPDETHGCPITPPFPVEDNGNRGYWKTLLPELPVGLQKATGAGVTVFILDAFPSPRQIVRAANAAGKQNRLLSQMVDGMVSDTPFQARPPSIGLNYTYNIPDPSETAVTGKDIYGRLSGFPMPDHGMFIAGLIRDLAPEASIECIRVMNDFGVGDFMSFFQALTMIEERLRPDGNLYGQPVVVNLSLVIGPPECELARLGLEPRVTCQAEDTSSLPVLLSGLLNLMQSMARQGVTFVAAAGNDSDPRDFAMNPSEIHFNARYPAAFANPTDDFPLFKAIIPVGAVNRKGEPATYSNYPGPYGVATYGGEVPKPDPWLPSGKRTITRVDTTDPIDALRGVYTGQAYPALSRNDQYPVAMQPEVPSMSDEMPYPQYDSEFVSAWTYWSGTSFATPIVAALAARILQNQSAPFQGEDVRAVVAATGHMITWTELEAGTEEPGSMILARQEWQNE